jgi:hypothetical protein
LVSEQHNSFKRKSTMKEKIHQRSSQMFHDIKFPNLAGGLNDAGGLGGGNEEETKVNGNTNGGGIMNMSFRATVGGGMIQSLLSAPTRDSDLRAALNMEQSEKRGLVGMSDSPERPSHIDRSDSLEFEVDENMKPIMINQPSRGREQFEVLMKGGSLDEVRMDEKMKQQRSQDELKEEDDDEGDDDDDDDDEEEEEVVVVKNSDLKDSKTLWHVG